VSVSVSGSLFDAEYRVIAKDGSVVWLRDIGRTVNDEDGRPVLIRGLMTDITARKTLEGTHDEVEGRFQRVVERLSEIVYMEQVEADPADLGRLIYVSPRVEQVLGDAQSVAVDLGGDDVGVRIDLLGVAHGAEA
jgi:PAS domain-containing protein